MDKKVKDLINAQINKEMYSAYLYLDFANYYHGEGLDGFGAWYDKQAEEELEHAIKFRDYLYDNGEKVKLEKIDKPDKKIKNLKDPLVFAAEHERYVTSLIYDIYKAARDADDFRTMEFLNWFISEQAEEEKNADDMVSKYGLFCSDGKGLYSFDKELASRND